MLIVLSPAKRLNEGPVDSLRGTTEPVFAEPALQLVEKLKKLSASKLRTLMGASTEIAALNHARFQAWEETPRKPAALLYDGEAYRKLDAPSLDADDRRFAQRHLRLLSGLYGVLRPYDLITPYRLEMGTRLPVGRAKDLYAFWGGRITAELADTARRNKDEVLLNLASEEYAKAIHPETLGVPVITPVFKERTAKGLRTVMVHAKHQRGAMARWIIQRRVLDADAIKTYEVDGYRFQPGESNGAEWLFAR